MKHVMGALGSGFVTTRLEDLLGWVRKYSLFQYPFVTACCGMEFMSLNGPVYDGLARFGAEAPRFSPRQADLLWVVGTISQRQGPALKRIYEQIADPKWVVAFGTCASCGGFYDNYTTIPGIDKIIPVDVYIPGCPPRPEAVIDGLMLLMDHIQNGGKRGQGLVVPPAQVPRLAQLKTKASTVDMAVAENKAVQENKRLAAQRGETLSDHLHDEDEARERVLRSKH